MRVLAVRDAARARSAVDVRRVAAHNHQDVVTLARLFLRLVEAEAASSA